MDDKFEDYYEVLGVPFGATKQEISKAFRAKAPLLHPDKHKDDPSAVKRFVLLGKAKDVLTDDKARAVYDALVKARRSQIERESKLDAERRRMIRELNERERQAKAKTPEDLEKEARTQLAAEIERLKGEGVLKDYTKADSKSEEESGSNSSTDGTLKFTFEKGAKRWRDRDAVERFMSAWGTVTGVVCKKASGVVSFSRMNFDPELVPELIATAAASGGAPPLSATWIRKPAAYVQQLKQQQPQPPPQQKFQERETDSSEIDLLEQDLFKKMMKKPSECEDTPKEPSTKRPKN